MISVYGGFPPKSVCVQFLAGKQDCQQFPFYVGVVSFSRSKCLTEKTYRFAVLDKNGTKAFQRCIGFNNGGLVGFIVSELNSISNLILDGV